MSRTVGVRGVTKRFGTQKALDDVSIEFRAGEIHGLAGMNGSGKSTLVKVLAGIYAADDGDVTVDGEAVRPMSARRAQELGFRFIHQEPAVFATQSVLDNLALGASYRHSGPGAVRVRAEQRAAEDALAAVGVDDIDLSAPLGDLSPAQRTMVTIARAVQDLDGNGRLGLLVMDEPTASLPEHEVELVTDVVRRVVERGIAVVYITHDLGALLDLSDRVSVLRDGSLITTTPTDQLGSRQLADLMAGDASEELARVRPEAGVADGPVVLSCERIEGGRLAPTDLSVRRGEIVGVAGLLGSGRSTLLRLIAGAQDRSGAVDVDGDVLPGGDPRAAIRAGVALVPEDRRGHAAFAGMTTAENLTIASLDGVAKPWWIGRRREAQAAREAMDEYDVRPRIPERRFGLLSGGNQQKAIIARWARTQPKLLLLDEPTQGVDVHARVQIHQAIAAMAERGMAVVVVSSDFGELTTLADRVAVMRRGRIHAELSGDRVSEAELLHLASND